MASKKKKLAKWQQVRKTMRRPDGVFISEKQAKTIARMARGKTDLAGAKEKFFNSHPWQKRKEPLRNPDTGRILSKLEASEIKEAARYLNIPLSQAKALHFEQKLIVEIEDYELAHTIESTLMQYLERNPDLIIRVKKAGSKHWTIAQGVEGVENFADELKVLQEIILKHQNKGKPKNKQTRRIDSPNLPYIQPVIERRPGRITPVKISFDFNKSETAATLEDKGNLEDMDF